MSLTLTLERGGGEVSGSGTNIELDGTIAGGAIESVEMYGDTEQQTYSGKNKYNATKASSTSNTVTTSADTGRLYVNGTTTTDFGIEFGYTSLPAGTYTFCLELVSGSIASTSAGGLFNFRGDNITLVSCPISNSNKKNSVQVTVSADTTNARIQLWCRTSETFTNAVVKYQLVSGSTADYDFEPYVGGTASPNPDYPQEVKTVTGEQTITISDGNGQSQSYTVDLGDIELCKIGKYQDYIYKSGNDWHLHKETAEMILDGTETIIKPFTNIFVVENLSGDWPKESEAVFYYCEDYYRLKSTGSNSSFNTLAADYGYAFDFTSSAIGRNIRLKDTRYDNVGSYKAWLASNNVTVYYAIVTPTDTKITNSDLIRQLNALNEATTYDGKTIITVSSENLAGSLEVTAATSIAKTYTEVEIGSPFTITDVEGKSSNTTLDGNVYVDWAYNKKQYSFDLFNLTPQDYADIRAFYDYQFNNSAFPTITVPELNIDKLPVYMEISSRNIINQCLLTDKLTIKFRETVQP